MCSLESHTKGMCQYGNQCQFHDNIILFPKEISSFTEERGLFQEERRLFRKQILVHKFRITQTSYYCDICENFEPHSMENCPYNDGNVKLKCCGIC